MIIESLMAITIVGAVILAPIKGVLVASAMADMAGKVPRATRISTPDVEIEAFLGDFVSQDGRAATDFLIGKTDQGVWTVLSKAEVQMKQEVSHIEAVLARGDVLSSDELRALTNIVRERDVEISNAPSRRARVRKK